MSVLVTGGAGYIGSAIALAFNDAGHETIVLDNLRVGRPGYATGTFYEGDIGDQAIIEHIFHRHADITCVIHCAAGAIIEESVREPWTYYELNVTRTLALVQALRSVGCRRLIFASSASIYTPGPDLMADESSPLQPRNPYARSKVMCEQLLQDIAKASDLRVLSLRFVTPLGADPLLRVGLQPGAQWRVLGALLRCVAEDRPFTVLGNHWPTRDGTPLRDYIHVWDVAAANLAAMDTFDTVANDDHPFRTINVGTGVGTTVLELVHTFEAISGHTVRLEWGEPRPGDTVGCVVSVARAASLLGWRAQHTLADAVSDALRWAERCAASSNAIPSALAPNADHIVTETKCIDRPVRSAGVWGA